MSAANEVAVAASLEGRIGFMDIPRVIDSTMQAHDTGPCSSIEAVIEADAWARSHAESLIRGQWSAAD
jgi:1-deoxy-D-xylulose-5-phosphate reductoisomerase